MDTLTRRRFMVASGVTAGAALAVGGTGVAVADLISRARTDPLPAGTGVLVLVTLYGGNDGLGTVVPYADPAYAANRPGMAYTPQQVIHLDSVVGLNPAMTGFKRQWDAGRLAIVQGVGYPRPDHSHFRSMSIWQTASPQTPVPTGWLGRWLDAGEADPIRAVSLGPVLPPVLAGASRAAAALDVGPLRPPPTTVQDALATMATAYPGEPALVQAAARSGADLLSVIHTLGPVLATAPSPTPAGRPAKTVTASAAGSPPTAASSGARTGALAAQLDVVATCIRAAVPTRVYSVSLGGFDTHSDELGTQSTLLGEVDSAVSSFVDTVAGSPHGQGVAVLIYSEFGRRVTANASQGTDHGTAGPMFLLGPSVHGGLVGAHPSLTDLDQGDLKFGIDFRSVYATVLADLLGADPDPILPGNFPHLPLLRT